MDLSADSPRAETTVLPKMKTELLLARIKKLVNMWADEEQMNGNNVFYWNILSNPKMMNIANEVPTTIEELADFELPQNVIKQYGERLVKNFNAFIKQENLQKYIDARPQKKKQKTVGFLSFDFDNSSNRGRKTLMMSPNLVDLPLTAVADYLTSTNRLLLAVALTTPSSSSGAVGWNNVKLSTASKAVLASKECWELDLAETNLVDMLSDDDLRTLLLSIDAKNTLKTLQIGGCTQIVGHGLEPLRGSTVLERLSLPDRLSNGVDNALSIDIVIPIIVSIINAGTNPLDRLDLLRNLSRGWLREQSRNETPIREVLTNINQLLLNENGVCSCGNPFIRACFTCFERTCSVDQPCDDRPYCYLCDNCGITLCESCDDSAGCNGGCQSNYCSVCAQLDDVDAALECEKDNCYPCCFACASSFAYHCEKCVQMHYPKVIARQRAEIAQLRQQIDQLQLNED